MNGDDSGDSGYLNATEINHQANRKDKTKPNQFATCLLLVRL